jgi:hypothetical protein
VSAEFGPLRVRRYRVPEPPPPLLPQREDEASTIAPDPLSSEPAIIAEPAGIEKLAVHDEPTAREPSYDEERLRAAVREEAIRFASIAAARALRVALVDEAAIAKYVDDALRACGRGGRATVRLHPRDARVYRSTHDVDVIGDDSCQASQVVIELPTGSLGATVDERAALLVRAAAC